MVMSPKLIMSSIFYVILLLVVLPSLATAQKIITSPPSEFSIICNMPVGYDPKQYAIYLINKEKTPQEQQQLVCMNQVLIKQMYESGIDPVQHLQESMGKVAEQYKHTN